MYWYNSNSRDKITRPDDGKSKWDELKDDYKKENPDLIKMGDKIIGPSKANYKIPPKDYILPLPA